MNRALPVLATAALFCASTADAAAIITSDYQGWVNSSGSGNGASQGNNTFTGNEYGNRFNSWASFDLAGVTGNVTGATLDLPAATYPPGTSSYTAGLYDVSTSLSSLSAGTAGQAGYTDLGTGNEYAQLVVSNGNYSVSLSSQAVADINAHKGGEFIIGFTNISLNSQNPNGVDLGFYNNGYFGASANALQLALNTGASATPEPASLTLLGLGGLGLAGYGWRRRRLAVTA